MKCEVIAVGSELLLGQIVDTNSSWIGEHLAAAGLDSHFQTKVGDNADRIAASLRLALSRSDAVIMCGGLGPTQDDITRDVIASVMGVELVHDETIAERIRTMFSSRGRDMPGNNLRQALVPAGAATIPQQPGTAPGLVCPITVDGAAKVIYAVPGVPSEMKEMVLGTVVPDLTTRSGEVAVISSRVLRTWGHSESGIAEMLADYITELDSSGDATLAFLASGVEGLKVRLTAKAPDDAQVAAILDRHEAGVRAILGPLVFGVDDDTMESVIVEALVRSASSMAIVETVSGGFLTNRLSAVAAAEQVVVGSLVATSFRARGALPVNASDHDHGADPASEAASIDLAKRAQQMFGSDVAVATTGATTSTPVDGVEAGSVFAAAIIGDAVHTWSWVFPGDADRVRQFSCIGLLNELRRVI